MPSQQSPKQVSSLETMVHLTLDGQLTRAQLAKVLVEAFDLKGSTRHPLKMFHLDHWANEYINTLYHNKITTGYGDGNFGLNDNVTANNSRNLSIA